MDRMVDHMVERMVGITVAHHELERTICTMRRRTLFASIGIVVVAGALGFASLRVGNAGPATAGDTTSAVDAAPVRATGTVSADFAADCNDNVQCIVDAIVRAAPALGPADALAQYRLIATEHPQMHSACHNHYERIGRAITLDAGITDHREAGCQFGFLHGVLYAVGETYDATSMDEMVARLIDYCAGFEADGSVSDPRTNCHHGIGHAIAEVTHNNPSAGLVACGTIPSSGARNCSDGVLMEYGDDYLYRVGVLRSTSAVEDDSGTEVDPAYMLRLCTDVPDYASFVCYARLWKFAVDDISDPSIANDICASARDDLDAQACHEGFGELVTLVAGKDHVRPAETPAIADTIARDTARHCLAMDLPTACLMGAIASSNSHLYAIDVDESLIPNPCVYVPDTYAAACAAAMANAQALNWDKTNSDAPDA